MAGHGLKEYIKWFFRAIDFRTVTLRYRVDYGGWYGGRLETFWLKSSAIRFAKQRGESFVEVRDELDERVIFKARWMEYSSEHNGYIQKSWDGYVGNYVECRYIEMGEKGGIGREYIEREAL